jgi:hypothetical protein
MFTGPSSLELNASLIKATRITEHRFLDLRVDAFNLFNHPVWGVASSSIDSPAFGRLGSNSRRLVQLTAMLRF